LLVGWLWFLGTLVPVIGLVQVGNAAMADRYTYFPLIGVFIAVTFGCRDLASRFRFPKAAVAAAAALILASCLVLTENQLRYWYNSESLFAHSLMVTTGDNSTARISYGIVLERKGLLAEALLQYREALRINPRSFEAHGNLGNLLDEMGKTDEALMQYQEALKLNPKAPLAHENLGTLLVKLGRFDEGMSQYEQAAQLDPNDFRSYYLMGKALLKQGRDVEAVGKFREALQLDPDNFQILTYTAYVLAADENSNVRDGKTALVFATKANAMTDGTQPSVLDVLGMAGAAAGHFQDAQQAEQRAIQLAQAAALEETNAMLQRLELYKSSQAYYEKFTNSSPQNVLKK
jgi:tetratricopeptide (TPR) repeat protein